MNIEVYQDKYEWWRWVADNGIDSGNAFKLCADAVDDAYEYFGVDAIASVEVNAYVSARATLALIHSSSR